MQAPQALDFLGNLFSADELNILTPTDRHFDVLKAIVNELGRPAGNLFHDIHTATLMREHGVREIVTADTDFLPFRFLVVSNPLLPKQ